MHGRLFSMAAGLSDAELLRRVVLLAGREREATVELVAHLAELDARKLHLAEGYGSLFAYCRGALRLAEHAAYNRIEAARLSRRFPAILDLLADGSLNLSTARLLAPHLRLDNFEALVAQARGRSKREVETLVAHLAPRPDVAASVRKLPARDADEPGAGPARPGGGAASLAVPHRGSTEASATLPPPAAARLPRRPLHHDGGVAASGRRNGRSSPRWRRSATVCSSRSAQRPTRSCAEPRSFCAARFRMAIPVRSSTGRLTLLLEAVARKKLAATSKPRHGHERADAVAPHPGARETRRVAA